VALLFYFATSIQPPQQLQIQRGSISKIITDLTRDYGLPLSQLDVYLLKFIGIPQSGWIDLGKGPMSRADLLYRLTTAKAALFPVQLIPGETTYDILRQLSRKYGYRLEVLQKEYDRLAPYPDGVLFAETYYLPKGIDEHGLMTFLVRESLRRHERLAHKLHGSFNPTLWFTRTVTIASIIQKEAANREEMPLVSAVIYNRLRLGMPLQMDGALNYGRFSHQKVTARRLREDRSPFNTYRHKGLPPYPVCIVGVDAIKAAVAPAKVDYLYFVRGPDGVHLFSKSYKAHLRNIQSVQKRNKSSKSPE